MGGKQSKKAGAPPERTLMTREEAERIAREAEEAQMQMFKKDVVRLMFDLDDTMRHSFTIAGFSSPFPVHRVLRDVRADAPYFDASFASVSSDDYAEKLFEVLNEMLAERKSQWIVQELSLYTSPINGVETLTFNIAFDTPPAYEKSVYKRQKMNEKCGRKRKWG